MSTLFIFYLEKYVIIEAVYRDQIHALLHHSVEQQENVQARAKRQPQKKQEERG